jgi:subtilisin family serine protease
MSGVRLRLDHPALVGRTGRGVRVAVVDSGIAAGHSHVGDVAGGTHLLPDGDDQDYADRIGHGTAVAAAIREKAPGVELLAVRVFDHELATTADVLARGIVWAADHGARLINLSLGTDNPAHEPALAAAVRYAATHHALVVAALGEGRLPGALDSVVGVELDWDCPRDEVGVREEQNRPIFTASGYPRPIPGVPPDRNLKGISFAVANVSGILARLLED